MFKKVEKGLNFEEEKIIEKTFYKFLFS